MPDSFSTDDATVEIGNERTIGQRDVADGDRRVRSNAATNASEPGPHSDVATDAFGCVDRLRNNMAAVVLGKPLVIDQLLTVLLAGGHVLLEDIPGVGKTLAAKSLAQSIDGRLSRLQFTPDLLPSDITGSSIYRADTGQFEFNAGPIFANVVVADEVNRAPPRTQSALLEAMSESRVSVDGQTHVLPAPFMVVATQNPFEFEGTYPLPESQLDRFLLRTSVGYPDREQQFEVLRSHRSGETVESLRAVASADEVAQVQRFVHNVRVDDAIAHYILDIVEATRRHDGFRVGVSIRGALGFYRACQAAAVVAGRDHVLPDDAKNLAVPVLAHRVTPEGLYGGSGGGIGGGSDRSAVETQIDDLVQQIAVPM